MHQKILIFDNGASTIKAELSSAQHPRVLPNYIFKQKLERKRVYVADQIAEIKDLSSLYIQQVFQRGLLVHWDVQHQIWDHVFSKECLNVDPGNTAIVLTEPFFNFASIQEATNEILFEDYQFDRLMRTNAPTLSARRNYTLKPDKPCCLVIDVGYSFTHIAPYCKGELVKDGVVRISIGGKILTNQLKEIISYRQLQVMDETYIINQCKEDSCFVSLDFDCDMRIAKKRGAENTIVRDYVLPDFVNVTRGYVCKPEDSKTETNTENQKVRLNHERFTVPEILFRPSDIQIDEMGIAEAAVHSVVSKCSAELRPYLFRNILVIGGSSLFPNFCQRLEGEIRALAPDLYDVIVSHAEDPVCDPWFGGKSIAESEEFGAFSVSRKEYEEQGNRICVEKFKL